MNLFARPITYLHRWSNPLAAVLLLSASSTLSSGAHADPADFQAMPGLWKITLHTVKDGHVGETSIKWKCLYDGGDPWTTLVDAMQPDTNCQRSEGHRTSTALAWKVSCGAQSGQGHIALDSAEHYAGAVALDGKEVLQVEGKRYAACTGPSD